MTLNTIAQILGVDIKNNVSAEINWLLTDSRSLAFPAESLFFAIPTARNNGHNYISDLYEQNLRYFVVSELHPEYEHLQDAIFLYVPNTVNALQQIATHRRNEFDLPVIGITGSNGKTQIKEWLFQLLSSTYNITRSPRSYNSQIGVPLAVWTLNQHTELGIFEAGISEPYEMERLERIIKPTIGIFTNLGEAHQENFISLKQKCEEKLKLFKHAEVLVYCSDNKLIDITIQQSNLKIKKLDWGVNNNAKLKISEIEKSTSHSSITYIYDSISSQLKIPFTDQASIENLMHCLTLMLYFGIDRTEIEKRMALLEPLAMRLEVKDGVNNCLIINDSYNSDLSSLNIALDFLTQQASTKNLSKTIILSDILQTGLSSEDLYTKVSELLDAYGINRIFGIGTEISKFHYIFQTEEKQFFETVSAFLQSSYVHQFRQNAVLLKGARKFHFEDISERLELIAHETILEVNLNALIDNFNYFRSKLRTETKVMCMVKAFAYGSGSVEVARTLQHHRCDYLAVAVADEGAELRREGIHIPIVVMNPEKNGFGVIFDNNLEPEIYSFRLLDLFISAVDKQGLSNYPIHIKIDSGMHRLGFELQDIDRLINQLKNQTQVKVRSVFSHLAGSDETQFDDFTRQQVAVYNACANKIRAAFLHPILCHILNSAGIERFSDYQYDMVRLGIGLYGISAISTVKLKQVSTLKTVILQIKNINEGETVGYSRKGAVLTNKRIAILPIGYADGFDRKLGNGVGEVLVNGKRAKLIGNVCMDLIMIDITNIDAQEGDAVEIFGENITITEFAGWLKTIAYEVLTSISRRVKRVYFQE